MDPGEASFLLYKMQEENLHLRCALRFALDALEIALDPEYDRMMHCAYWREFIERVRSLCES